jgi:hypothetical protein
MLYGGLFATSLVQPKSDQVPDGASTASPAVSVKPSACEFQMSIKHLYRQMYDVYIATLSSECSLSSSAEFNREYWCTDAQCGQIQCLSTRTHACG